MKTIAVKLQTKVERAIKKGHPWVFEDGIVQQNKSAETGDVAIIFDKKSNKLLAVGLFDPNSPIRIRVISLRKSIAIDEDFFSSRILTAKERRAPLLQTETNAYRLIYGENDHLPGIIIDVYDQSYVIKLYSAIWFPYLETLVAALIRTESVEHIVLRMARILIGKHSNYPKECLLWGDQDFDGEVIFKEHGLLFSSNIIHGHKTGFFLDHRHNRLKIRSLSKNKRVLDVFSYSGGFSIHAMAGGAQAVTAVDWSRQALDHAEQNASLNALKGIFHTLQGDAFEILEKMVLAKESFDLMIIDPPSFAKMRSQKDTAINSYRRLLSLALKLCEKGGIILFASCSSRVDLEEFLSLIQHEINGSSRSSEFLIIDQQEHDIDHPQGIKELNYLKAIYIQRKSIADIKKSSSRRKK